MATSLSSIFIKILFLKQGQFPQASTLISTAMIFPTEVWAKLLLEQNVTEEGFPRNLQFTAVRGFPVSK